MEILLFTRELDYATAAMQAGVSGVVVDWEWAGKTGRQRGFDTEISRGLPEDLARMRAAVSGALICRINNRARTRVEDARLAEDLGADEIWLPMVRSVAEVAECLEALTGRARLGIQAETGEALRLGRELTQLPLTRVYVGLNDLCIDLGRETLFETLVDGTVDAFRAEFDGPFGVAGVTVPDAGRPVPQRLLLAEMARLGCAFGVGRRSFRRDVPQEGLGVALQAIRSEYARLRRRSQDAVDRDHEALRETVVALATTAGLPS